MHAAPHAFMMGILALIIFGPMLFFVLKAFAPERNAEHLALLEKAKYDATWKEPEPYRVDLPADMVCKIVTDTLPNCFFGGTSWDILNAEIGNPITVAANMSFVDDRHPDAIERTDVGLVTSIVDQGPAGHGTLVKMRFIVYEGEGPQLEDLSNMTYNFVQKSLRAQSNLSAQPPAVRAESAAAPVPIPPARRADSAAGPGLKDNNLAHMVERSIFSPGEADEGETNFGKREGGAYAREEGSLALPGHEFDAKKLTDIAPLFAEVNGTDSPQAPAAESSIADFMQDYDRAPLAQFIPEVADRAPLAQFIPEVADRAPLAQFIPEVADRAPLAQFMPDVNMPDTGGAQASSAAQQPLTGPAVPQLSVPAPAPPAMPSVQPSSSPAPAQPAAAYVVPAPQQPLSKMPSFEAPTFDLPPAPVLANPALPPQPAPSAQSAGTASGLCPGCSQAINPSFQFCLYCGKNF